MPPAPPRRPLATAADQFAGLKRSVVDQRLAVAPLAAAQPGERALAEIDRHGNPAAILLDSLRRARLVLAGEILPAGQKAPHHGPAGGGKHEPIRSVRDDGAIRQQFPDFGGIDRRPAGEAAGGERRCQDMAAGDPFETGSARRQPPRQPGRSPRGHHDRSPVRPDRPRERDAARSRQSTS
jgi:hypothetical protein